MANSGEQRRTTGIVILATLAVVAALYWGAEFLFPIALAIVLNTLLRPAIRALVRVRVPAPLGAAIVVLALVGLLVAIGFALAAPARDWLAQAPQRFTAAQAKVARLREPIQKLTNTANRLGQPSPEPTAAPPSSGEGHSLWSSLAGAAMHVAGGTARVVEEAIEVLLLVYLLVAFGGLFPQKLLRVLQHPDEKRLADETVNEAEGVVFRYVTVAAMIFFCQGTVVALVMWWLRMPSPLLWGVATFVLEFIPYFGATVMVALLSVTAVATFDSLGRILLAPGSYLLITSIQNSVVSPMAYGHSLKLNPVVVLIGVMFWWFVWGVLGAFLAVPILAALKVLADRTESLRPIGEFLGE